VDKPRHSFTGERTNMQAQLDDAQRRMFDARQPESTIVHYHAAHEVCDGTVEHRVYDHLIGQCAVYEVGIDLPEEYKTSPVEKSPAMSDNWFKTSSG
jgi:hypothetical protein